MEKLNAPSQNVLDAYTSKEPHELSGKELAFIAARWDYLRPEQKAIFKAAIAESRKPAKVAPKAKKAPKAKAKKASKK